MIPQPLIALPLTYAVATCSYYLLERRFLTGRARAVPAAVPALARV